MPSFAFILEDFTDRVSANILLLERDLLVEPRPYREIVHRQGARQTMESIQLVMIIYFGLNIVNSYTNLT